MNKNGIPVAMRKVCKRMKQQKRQLEVHKLDFHHFVQFRRYEYGIEVTITVPAFSPLTKTLQKDGWKFVSVTKGEIA
ncbi:hypothetical protein [Lysinibacillus composti]|nr:hypothetical protein [Lysinibacillus composti]